MSKLFKFRYIFFFQLFLCNLAYCQNSIIEKRIDSLRLALKEAELQRLKINDQITLIEGEIRKNSGLLAPGLRSDGRHDVMPSTTSYLMSEADYKSEVVIKIPASAWLIVDKRKKYGDGYFEAEYNGMKGYIYESVVSQTNTESLMSSPSKTNSGTKTSSNGATQSTVARTYISGPKGGCYYINSAGNKVYVDKSNCK